MWSSRLPEHGIDAGHRLVEQEQLRPSHQRPGQLQQLALPAGEGPGVVVRELGQVEDLEQLHRLRADLLLAPPHGTRPQDQVSESLPGLVGAASIMLSITGIAASALVIWKVRTIPLRAIS